MTFDYEVENEEGEVVATYKVDVVFEEDVPGIFSGRPERCRPTSGGDILDLIVHLGNKNVTQTISDDLYFKLRDEAKKRKR